MSYSFYCYPGIDAQDDADVIEIKIDSRVHADGEESINIHACIINPETGQFQEITFVSFPLHDAAEVAYGVLKCWQEATACPAI